MIFQHHRFQIWNKNQHPYSHSLDEFTYVNDSLPIGEVQNAKQAMDWILAVLYPNQKPPVDTPGDLPTTGNTLNDYRVVNDDGDGKAASYRWEQREGDVSPKWYKIYDMDWGEQSILSNFLTKTQDVYVFRYGVDDLDSTGTPFAGDLAGQRIYGGQSPNTHLTFYANSGDGTGAATGYIQFGDNSRPLQDSAFTLGTDTYRFLNFYTDEANSGTLKLTSGSITDSSGAIDFGDENLSTLGSVAISTLLLQGGSITDSTGAIDFSDENLTTLGLITGDGGVDVGSVEIRTGGAIATALASGDDFTFTPDGGTSNFVGDVDVSGNLSAQDATLQDSLTVVSLDNTKALSIVSNNSGIAQYQASLQHSFSGPTATDILQLTESLITFLQSSEFQGAQTSWKSGATEYLRITQNNIDALTENLTVNSDGTLSFTSLNPISFNQTVLPSVDTAQDLGSSALRWSSLYLGTGISDGTNSIDMATLLSFRDALVGAGAGMSLFYDGTKWTPSIPDTEIDHGIISGLLDDDHTQYVLLAGRASGQTIIGGSGASENLTLQSTSDATKGAIVFSDKLLPSLANTIDIGDSASPFEDLYLHGQAKGMRLENAANFAALPAASASRTGRAAWVVDTETLYVDRGGSWKQITSDKYVFDDATTWDGTATTQTYTVSGEIDDARNAVWQFLDNTNGFRNVQGAVITKTQTQVTVTFTIPPASGTYRLVGVG